MYVMVLFTDYAVSDNTEKCLEKIITLARESHAAIMFLIDMCSINDDMEPFLRLILSFRLQGHIKMVFAMSSGLGSICFLNIGI